MTANELRELRTRLGWGTAQLARHLEIAPALVQAWETGNAFPTRRHVERLEALARLPVPPESPAATRPAAKGSAQPSAPPKAAELPGPARSFAALLEDPAFRHLLTRLVEDGPFRQSCLTLASDGAPLSAGGKQVEAPAPAPHCPGEEQDGPAAEQHGPAAEQHGPAAEQHGPAAEQHGPAAEQHGPREESPAHRD